MSRRTFALLTLGLLVSSIFLSSCSRSQPVWPNMPGKKKVLASFAPIFCFAKAVAGDDANVLCLLTNQGPHGAEMSPADVAKFREADIILCNGLGLDEPQLQKTLKKLGLEGKVPLIEIGEAIEEKYRLHKLDHEEHVKEEKGHGHEHGEHDPHIWLSPVMAMAMVDQIALELGKIDPAHKDAYLKRAAAYNQELDKLHKYGLAKFKDKKNLSIVAQHDSLAYFADAFKLKVIGHLRTQANEEASPAEEADLLKICKDKHPAAITIEPLFAGKGSQILQKTLARAKIDVQLVNVDPLETAPLAEDSLNPDPGWYLQRMRENIDNLDKALP